MIDIRLYLLHCSTDVKNYYFFKLDAIFLIYEKQILVLIYEKRIVVFELNKKNDF